MSIESSKNGIDYKSIADVYGYKPVPEGFQPIPPVDISIDWQIGAKQRKLQEQAVMNRNPNYKVETYHPCYRSNISLPTNLGNFNLEVTVTTTEASDREKINLFLALTNTADNDVARYFVSKYDSVWHINHRITNEKYRGKGIASHMLNEIDNCIQAYANTTGQTEEVVLNTSQLSVLGIFLKHGYEVIDEDKQRFDDLIKKLEDGNPQYVIASCEADFREGNDERKTWYIFERRMYEKLGEKIWEDDPIDRSANYLKYSVCFKLRKKIEPRNDDIARETSRVGRKVHSLGK